MEASVSWRNIWRNKRRTYVILTAIVIGISSMIFLASFMRGVMEGMIENSVDELTGHIKIQNSMFREDPSIENIIENPDEIIEQIHKVFPENTRTAKRIVLDSVVNTARESYGVKLVAIDFENEKGLSFIGDCKISGEPFTGEDSSSAIMGMALAGKLGLGTGKRFVLTARNINGEVSSGSFKIKGLYLAEMELTEKLYLFIPFKGAEKLLHLNGEVTEISVKLPYKSIAKKDLSPLNIKINSLLNENLKSETWKELLPSVEAYLTLFDQFLFIWYLVVFIAMGFGIVNTILMAVFERMREFGLLKAIGMKPFRIFKMVLTETLFLLVVGMVAGNLAGFLIILMFSKSGIDLSAFSRGIEMLKFKRTIFLIIESKDVIIANLTVFILGLIVGIYPAVRAAKFSPIETMRMN